MALVKHVGFLSILMSVLLSVCLFVCTSLTLFVINPAPMNCLSLVIK